MLEVDLPRVDAARRAARRRCASCAPVCGSRTTASSATAAGAATRCASSSACWRRRRARRSSPSAGARPTGGSRPRSTGRAQGLRVVLVLVDQPMSPHAVEQFERIRRSGARVVLVKGKAGAAARLPGLWLHYRRPWILPAGGSTPLGAVGYVRRRAGDRRAGAGGRAARARPDRVRGRDGRDGGRPRGRAAGGRAAHARARRDRQRQAAPRRRPHRRRSPSAARGCCASRAPTSAGSTSARRPSR